ncbi:MAG: NAD(+) diphosphatase [Kofleriaceae bacterium]
MFVPGIATTASSGRHYVVTGQQLLVCEGNTIPRGPATPASIFLGELDGEACFGTASESHPGATATSLRQLFGVLSDDDFGIAFRALGVTTWDRDHRHCGRCGGATERSTVERVRTCTACSHPAYPRLSPAVIVAVERDGRLLLARNARTRSPFHSVLAGFVEVGESLEACVAREIHEESGIVLRDIRYFGSQPWPFTSSLMIGFTAQWASGELVADETEVYELDWFAPEALPTLPPHLSISRDLIDDFVRRATIAR